MAKPLKQIHVVFRAHVDETPDGPKKMFAYALRGYTDFAKAEQRVRDEQSNFLVQRIHWIETVNVD